MAVVRQAPGIEEMSDVPTTALPESLLVSGYRALGVTERCACGQSITALSTWPADIRDAVMAHQQTVVHRAWRTWREAHAGED